MWQWLFSIAAGYKISEWICGPWVKPEYRPPQPPTEAIDEAKSEDGPRKRTIFMHGIGFDEDMKHLGD